MANGRLKATADQRQLSEADAISICVPTPLTKTKRYASAATTQSWNTAGSLGGNAAKCIAIAQKLNNLALLAYDSLCRAPSE